MRTLVVVGLLGAASLAAAGFAAFYVVEPETQWLGLTLGLAFAFLSIAAIVAGKALVPQEEIESDVGPDEDPDERERAARTVESAGAGVSRRGLLLTAAGGTAGVVGAALVLPAASLGPLLESERLLRTPWRDGRRLVDSDGRPIRAADIEVGSFVTAFAAGVDRKRLDASLVVVRLEPGELRLAPERRGWAPDGLVAYSKICTHAGCAVSELDYPLYPPTSPRARLVCPCHYSAFDAGGGGDVVAGPAGRPLPQLPLRIADDGTLVAGGDLSAPPGPSWSGVRQR